MAMLNTSIEEEASLCLDILGSHSRTPLYATVIISLTLCVIGNSTICLIVARHYQLHTVTNANIVNMAVAHLLFSIFCVPSYLSMLNQRHVSQWLCSWLGFSFTFFATGSTLALMLIAFERYYVIISRRNSSSQWTARRAKKSILGTWLVALMLSIPWVVISDDPLPCTKTLYNHSVTIHRLNQCLPFLNPPTSKLLRFLNIFLVLLCFVLPLATVATLYCRMVGPLWRGYNQVRPLGAGHPKTIRYTAEIRTARTMLLMFILFLCCWVTYCFIAISNALNWPFKYNTNETLTIASISLAFISFSLDPIIYVLRNPRISAMMIFRGRNRKRRRVKFGVSEFATDGDRAVSEQTSKWIYGRCAAESTLETTASKSEDFRVPSAAQTASPSIQSGSVLSFSYHVGVQDEEPKLLIEKTA